MNPTWLVYTHSSFRTHSMIIHTLLFIFSVKCGSAELRIPTQEYVGMIVDCQRYYRENSCVFLITSSAEWLTNHRKLTEILKQLSYHSIAGVYLSVALMDQTDLKCSGSRPLNVILTNDQETFSSLILLNKVPAYPRWLMFVEDLPEKYFRHVYVPFNCEFLLAERHNVITLEPLFELHEVYRVDEDSPLNLKYFGKWSFQLGFSVSKLSLLMRRNDLQGMKIRAAARSAWPAVTLTHGENSTIQLGGYMGEIWTSLQENTNFTTELHSLEGVKDVQLPNGTWGGVFAMIEKQQVQVCINAASLTMTRLDVVDFLFPLYTSYQRVFVQSPSSINLKWNNFLDPFVFHLWMSILAFIVCVGSILFIVERVGQRCHVHDSPAARGFVESILFMHGFCCQQGQDSTPQAMSGRIVYIIGALTSVILMAAYSAVLISFLSVQTTVFPVNNFEEMISDGRYKLGIIGGSGFYTLFEESSEPLIQNIYYQLILPDKYNLPKDDGEGLRRICYDKHYSYMTAYETSVGYWSNPPCAISPLPSVTIPRLNSMLISKDSPYKELINFYLLRLRQSGSLQRSHQEFWPPVRHQKDEDFKSVTFEQMVPIFTVCLGGYVFGLLVLVIEIYINKHRADLASNKRQPIQTPPKISLTDNEKPSTR